MIKSIQALRFYAALAIVVYHACRQFCADTGNQYVNLILTEKLAFGVDIFFVISGYVIYSSFLKKNKTPIEFMFDRLFRIAPMYWLTTIVFTLMLMVNFSIYPISDVSISGFIKSILFVPSKNLLGTYLPIHSVGWTLNMEIMFYLLFTISIMFSTKHIGIVLAVLISILYISGNFLPFMSFYHDAILFEFLLGCFIAFITSKIKPNISVALSVFILVLCVVVMMFGVESDRLVFWGIPSVIIVFTLVVIDRELNVRDYMMLLGAASYSLYLVHRIVISAILWVSGSSEYVLLKIIISVVLSVYMSVLSYKFVEVPLNKWIKSKNTKPLIN